MGKIVITVNEEPTAKTKWHIQVKKIIALLFL